jgi:hypothetical protein
MNFRARLNKLEQRREAATGETFRLLVRPVVGPTDLTESTCKRTLCADGSLWEIVHLNGSGSDLSEGELKRFIASFPLERAANKR